MWLAARDGHRAEVVAGLVERIYRAYFAEGRDIGSPATLAEVAQEAGLEGARVVEQLASPAGIAEVRALERRAGTLGVDAPPFLLINGKLGIRGTRSMAVLRDKIAGGSWFGIDRRRHASNEPKIDQILVDSFPASDAPPWTLGVTDEAP